MNNRPSTRVAPSTAGLAAAGVAASLITMSLFAGCGRRDPAAPPPTPAPHLQETSTSNEIPLPVTDQRLCTAIVVIVDTSGSMSGRVGDRGGTRRPKADIARDALQRIIAYTDTWKASHPDRALQMGLYSFSSSVRELLEMGVFDREKAEAAVARIPPPGSNTAIGEAIRSGFEALYRSGCTRKYLVCITDGENTTGPRPDRVARQLYQQTGGEVEMHFVAFDTSSRNFAFLKHVNGNVVEAADGEQLQARLSDIYEKRILAETMPAEQ